jgi:hypothetical protein
MAINRRRGHGGAKLFTVMAGLLVVLIPWTGALSQGKEPNAADIHHRGREKVYIAVQQGRLSVDLREVDIGEVLVRIGQETGIPILFAPSSGKRIGAYFANVELDEGLRRLLRLASLSHIILYTRGPSGAVAIKEVRVFEEERQGAPPQPMVAERNGEGGSEDPDQRFADVFARAHAIVRPSSGPEAGEIAQRFEEILESIGQGGASSPTPDNAAEGSEQQSEEPREPKDPQQ